MTPRRFSCASRSRNIRAIWGRPTMALTVEARPARDLHDGSTRSRLGWQIAWTLRSNLSCRPRRIGAELSIKGPSRIPQCRAISSLMSASIGARSRYRCVTRRRPCRPHEPFGVVEIDDKTSVRQDPTGAREILRLQRQHGRASAGSVGSPRTRRKVTAARRSIIPPAAGGCIRARASSRRRAPSSLRRDTRGWSQKARGFGVEVRGVELDPAIGKPRVADERPQQEVDLPMLKQTQQNSRKVFRPAAGGLPVAEVLAAHVRTPPRMSWDSANADCQATDSCGCASPKA